MAYNETAAFSLIGKERTNDFQCNHVVNEVLTGTKYGKLAKEYLDYGKLVTKPEAGVVVVGTYGDHVGIFISETEFIHSSTSKMKVIRASLDQLKWVFPRGYQFRKE